MRIYTVTLNPALDLSGHVHEILPNEKNYTYNTRLDPGGNGINAARMAARLHNEVTALGFLGGAPGREIRAMLARDPSTRLVRQRFTTIQNDTRINVTVTNEADHNQTRLTFPGPRISSAEKTKLLKTVRGLREKGILILGGSYPPGCDDGFARSLLNAASRAGLGLIVDVPAAFLLPLIADAGPRLLLIKPNQHELEEMVGKRLRSAAALQAAMLRLRKRAAMVCVSLGPQGALLGAGGRLWRCQPLKIHARGSVGAGDSMVGAMATRLEKWGIISPEQVDQASEKVIRDIFAWGVAAGAATAEAQGTALAHPARIRQLVGRVKIEPLRS